MLVDGWLLEELFFLFPFFSPYLCCCPSPLKKFLKQSLNRQEALGLGKDRDLLSFLLQEKSGYWRRLLKVSHVY